MGEVEYYLGKTQSSERHLKKALEIDRSNPSTLYWLGRVKEREGLESQAVEYWEEAIKIDNTHIPSHYQLAQFYLRRNSAEQATQHLNLVQKLSEAKAQRDSNPGKVYLQTQ